MCVVLSLSPFLRKKEACLNVAREACRVHSQRRRGKVNVRATLQPCCRVCSPLALVFSSSRAKLVPAREWYDKVGTCTYKTQYNSKRRRFTMFEKVSAEPIELIIETGNHGGKAQDNGTFRGRLLVYLQVYGNPKQSARPFKPSTSSILNQLNGCRDLRAHNKALQVLQFALLQFVRSIDVSCSVNCSGQLRNFRTSASSSSFFHSRAADGRLQRYTKHPRRRLDHRS